MIDFLILGLFVFACLAAVLQPSWSFAFVFVMYSFEQALQSSGGAFLMRPYLGNLCIGISVLLCLIQLFLRERNILYGHINYALISTLILLSWAAFSLLWTPSFGPATTIIIGNLPFVALFVLTIPLFASDISSVGLILNKIIYLGTLILLLILLSPNFNFRDGRIGFNLTAIYRSNPLALGELGGVLVIIASLLRTTSSQWILTIWRIAAFLIGTLMGLQSGSRGQIGFAIIIAIAFYPLSRSVKSFRSFFATVFGLILIITSVLVIANKGLDINTLSRWDVTKLAGGAGHRLDNILELLASWVSHPVAWLAGLGTNAYSAVTATGGKEEYAHNVAIEILCELGLPAFILFISLLVVSVKRAIELFWRFSQEPIARSILSAVFALFFYQLFLSLKQGNLWNSVSFFCFACIIIRLCSRVNESDQSLIDSNNLNSYETTNQNEGSDSNFA